MLIIGPPGTAKSMLADELCRRIEGANYFQWLLTKFSTPEEIFGAVSLKGLEQDDYRRVTSHKLPEAHIAFLDEIFKANSSILNALLTMINERLFHNGRERVAVPLITMFGASNELPDEEELTALFDRFMLRFMVDYIGEEFRFLKMLEGTRSARAHHADASPSSTSCARRRRGRSAGQRLARDRQNCAASSARQQIIVSDRRWRNSLDVLRAHAFLCGRTTVTEDDLDVSRARAVEGPRGTAQGPRRDPAAGQGLRGGGARTVDPEPGAARIRRSRDGRATNCASAR